MKVTINNYRNIFAILKIRINHGLGYFSMQRFMKITRVILIFLCFILCLGLFSFKYFNNTVKTRNESHKTIVDANIFNINKHTKFKFEYPDFEVFYDSFVSNFEFQYSRVKFPIKGTNNSFNGEEIWDKDNWPVMNWDFRDELKNTEDSISIVQDSIKFFFGTYCRDCGFSFEMEFNKIEGLWYLVYRQENSF